MDLDYVALWIGAILTLMVYSYLIADNPLFRLAEHLLVGTALGYAALVVIDQVLVPSLRQVLFPPDGNAVASLVTGLGLVWGLLLAFWLARPTRWLASWPIAIVLGVGAALAVGGALMGTIVPQVSATFLSLADSLWLNHLVIIVVVLSALTYFFFSIRRDRPLGRVVQAVSRFGRWCLMVALGSLLGARAVSLLSALVERFQFLSRWVGEILRLIRA